MATTAEKKAWIRARAGQKAESFAMRYGADARRRATHAERKRINREVRDEFQTEFGLSWITLLMWLPTIWSIVKALLDLRFGQATA